MIYDIFLFHSELDILELRLNILGEYVDKFVIVECEEDFKGSKKPLYYEDNRERFKKWQDKIEHHVIRDVMGDEALVEQAKNSFTTGKGEMQWLREFYIKESVKKYLTHLSDTDICFISDVDEIWNPKVLPLASIIPQRLKQKVYMYYLNVRTNEDWLGGMVVPYLHLKDVSLNELKANTKIAIDNGGWHFTYQGGMDQVRKKFESSFSSAAYGNQSIDELMFKATNCIDFLGRSFIFATDESDWPEYLKDNKEIYKHLCR